MLYSVLPETPDPIFTFGKTVDAKRLLEHEPELLCGALVIAFVAQVAGVRVDVEAALCERSDVIDDGCCDDASLRFAVLTKSVSAGETAKALLDSGISSKPFRAHRHNLQKR
jgi:hypothetical protein